MFIIAIAIALTSLLVEMDSLAHVIIVCQTVLVIQVQLSRSWHTEVCDPRPACITKKATYKIENGCTKAARELRNMAFSRYV